MALDKIAILVFITGFLLVLGIDTIRSSGQRLMASRAKKITASDVKRKLSEERPSESKELWRKLLSLAGGIFVAKRLGKYVDKRLEEADILLRGEEFVVVVVTVVLAAIFFITIITLNITAGLLSGLIAGIIPFLILDNTRSKRLMNFNGQISDALTIMSNSLRSGFSFIQAMDMVRKELPDPIKKEFTRTFREINLGTSTEEALGNLSTRVNSEDLDLVITAVLIQRQVGGNLAEVLDNISETLRERIRMKREIRTLTAQGRISGLIIEMLPIFMAVFLFFTNKQYIMQLFTDRIGQIMLAVAVLNELIGIYIIKRIVSIGL
ncbi:MAG TPA: secretion system protein [Thermoanaerobacterales bacterium]|jgi:tight adherence protein B|nr:secretion system protein [Thermoanaerobacterales bacterium]